MTTELLNLDLNKAIVGAVNARIESEMIAALSGDEVVGKFVTAALNQPVEVKGRDYRSRTEPFLVHVLNQAIQEAAQAAVRRLVAEELPQIEEEVRKALRRDLRRISETLAGSLVEAAGKPYGVSVALELKMPRAGD